MMGNEAQAGDTILDSPVKSLVVLEFTVCHVIALSQIADKLHVKL
jgi:hypothetical protein